jgi:hypothetical protein
VKAVSLLTRRNLWSTFGTARTKGSGEDEILNYIDDEPQLANYIKINKIMQEMHDVRMVKDGTNKSMLGTTEGKTSIENLNRERERN